MGTNEHTCKMFVKSTQIFFYILFIKKDFILYAVCIDRYSAFALSFQYTFTYALRSVWILFDNTYVINKLIFVFFTNIFVFFSIYFYTFYLFIYLRRANVCLSTFTSIFFSLLINMSMDMISGISMFLFFEYIFQCKKI